MGKFIKLENHDFMPVYVLKSDVSKVDIVGIEDDENNEDAKIETVDVHVNNQEDIEIYQLNGPEGFAANLVAQLEQDDSRTLWQEVKAECTNCGNTSPKIESES